MCDIFWFVGLLEETSQRVQMLLLLALAFIGTALSFFLAGSPRPLFTILWLYNHLQVQEWLWLSDFRILSNILEAKCSTSTG